MVSRGRLHSFRTVLNPTIRPLPTPLAAANVFRWSLRAWQPAPSFLDAALCFCHISTAGVEKIKHSQNVAFDWRSPRSAHSQTLQSVLSAIWFSVSMKVPCRATKRQKWWENRSLIMFYVVQCSTFAAPILRVNVPLVSQVLALWDHLVFLSPVGGLTKQRFHQEALNRRLNMPLL